MSPELEPTIILESTDQSPDLAETNVVADSTGYSRVLVESQSHSSDRLADVFNESTRALLRERLIMAMLVIATMMLVAQTLNFILGTGSTATLASRMTAAATLLGSAVFLWRRPDIKLANLRWLEIVVVVVPITEVMLVQFLEATRLIEMGKPNQFPTLVAALGSVVGLFIATYAMFIPSNWRRTAVVAFGYASVATTMTAAQLATMKGLEGIDPPRFTTTFVLFGTAIVATFSAHFFRSIRHDVESARQYGQYHLTTEIGRGGMGVVYRAEHRLLKRPAAIKLVRAECASSADAIARFEQEVQLSATLSHWNTVQIYDYGRTAVGDFYYVMEYLKGTTLAERLEIGGPMNPESAVKVINQICNGLEEAHAKSLVHRDLKPANVFLTDCGSQCDVVKILDFGLAISHASPTQDRSVSGSPAYMSPEQIRGDMVDGRSDIYAIGCVLYECLTGEPLFSGESVSAVFNQHLSGIPQLKLSDELSNSLGPIIKKCVSKSAADRYQDVGSLRKALNSGTSNE